MKRKLAVLCSIGLACLMLLDVGVHLLVVRGHWRPLPPLGAITNADQKAWLEGRINALATGADPAGIGVFDGTLGWSLRPSAVSEDGRTHTNARGWRGRIDLADHPGQGQLRIVCAGDSFTFCEEVADEEAWPHLLGERFGARAEVANLGVGGYGTDQALLRFARDYPRAAVDVVFIGLLLENIGRNVNRYRPRWYPRAGSATAKPRFIEGPETLELIGIPYDNELSLLNAVATGSVLDDLAQHEFWKEDFVPGPLGLSGLWRLYAGRRFYRERELPRLWGAREREPFRVTTRVLKAFHSFASSPEGNRARLVPILIFPTKDDLARLGQTGDRYWQPLLDWLIEEQLPFVDLSDALAAAEADRQPGDPELWTYSHLSPAGNAVVARTLYGYLELNL